MQSISVKEIAEVVGGKLSGAIVEAGARMVSVLSTDSRTVSDPEQTLFFAIKTERNDGHKYMAGLYPKGVRAFVVSEWFPEFDRMPEALFVRVENTLDALHKLAAWNRHRFQYPVLAITGSNGKTIVKEWLYELLKPKAIVRSPKSYNSQIGVPLSLWLMDAPYELAIIEAGISKPGEMQRLGAIIKPDIGIITNIGDAHQENFSSLKEKAIEKLRLFAHSKTLIYCRDNTLIHECLTDGSSDFAGKLFGWSFFEPSAQLFIEKKQLNGSTIFRVSNDGEPVDVVVPFTDSASLENAAQCLAFLVFFGELTRERIDAFARLQAVAMRLEMKDGINNCLLINDYYNSDINSLSIALAFQTNQVKTSLMQKTVILSDIQQSGIAPEELYRQVADMLQQNGVTRVIGIGPHIKVFASVFSPEARFFDSTDLFLEHLDQSTFNHENILLKGARDFHFERISSALQKKYHQTVLEIDLNNLVGNLNYFRSLLKPGTRIMVMVKAFSYGSGMVEIARVLQFQKVDYLAVAVADEGIELRQAGIDLPIIVMNPEEHSFESMIEFRLEPNIYSLGLFDSFLRSLQRNAVSGYPVHLKIDTGMHRLGFDSKESVQAVVDRLKQQSQMEVRSVFSHLAASDEPFHDYFTREQVDLFDELSSLVVKNLPYPVLRHILNSAGIERFPESQYDMVRLGIGLYGVSSKATPRVKPISRLKTTISQVRQIDIDQTVGYGRKGKVSRASQIAVLPIGYADGYDRRLGNGVGKVYVNGHFAHIIGNVCMDMCMVDVTGIEVQVGDEVELMGEHVLVVEMAQAIGTIPYEILTGISQRVKRIYVQE